MMKGLKDERRVEYGGVKQKKAPSFHGGGVWYWATTYSPTFFRQYHRRGRF